MAAVNLVNVTSINGFNVCGAVTTSATNIIDVPADKLYKINTIIISNVDGTNSANITIEISRDNGSNYFHIAKTVNVAAGDTVNILTKDAPIYLEETDKIKALASAASDLELVVSYEELDDA